MTLPAAASRAPVDIKGYLTPALAAALWRQRQIWIEMQLLSTGQTDGQTDGHPTIA